MRLLEKLMGLTHLKSSLYDGLSGALGEPRAVSRRLRRHCNQSSDPKHEGSIPASFIAALQLQRVPPLSPKDASAQGVAKDTRSRS